MLPVFSVVRVHAPRTLSGANYGADDGANDGANDGETSTKLEAQGRVASRRPKRRGR